jgi:hypothetical protein
MHSLLGASFILAIGMLLLMTGPMSMGDFSAGRGRRGVGLIGLGGSGGIITLLGLIDDIHVTLFLFHIIN